MISNRNINPDPPGQPLERTSYGVGKLASCIKSGSGGRTEAKRGRLEQPLYGAWRRFLR